MKATVWTSRDPRTGEGEPKCIFNGEIQAVPRIDEYIVLHDDFGAERVKNVTYDFVNGEVEISVYGTDPDNEYGPCLFRESLKGKP